LSQAGHGDRTSDPPSAPFPYDDAADIADYAKEAIGWAVDQKLIQGITASTVGPKEPTTRAEVATILMRYIQLTETKDK